MLEFTIFFAAFLLTAFGVALFKRLAISKKLWDIPNERSSHAVPKPRGGGIVIVAVCLSLYLAASVATGSDVKWSYVVAALIVAAVSWADDLFSLPASVRLLVHTAAAAALIAECGWITEIHIPVFSALKLGTPFGVLLTVVWLVWMTNAYNFMDGIDGIAGSQAVIAGVGWAVIGAIRSDPIEYLFGGIIAFSALGFLIHNWSPASIFMGDVGSAFLGFTLAAVPLIGTERLSGHAYSLFPAAALLLWLFLFDTVFTFLRRLLRGERVWHAHREHVYQKLVQSGYGHGTVSLIYGLLSAATTTSVAAAFGLGGRFDLVVPVTATAAALIVTVLARVKNV